MRPGRLAIALVLAGGLLCGPSASLAYVGELTEEGAKQLDEAAKRMAPVPYKPQPGGCARWQGRAFHSRYTGQSIACISPCALRLVETDGFNARWEVTGDVCGAMRQVAAPRAGAGGHLETVQPGRQVDQANAEPVRQAQPVRKGEAKNARDVQGPIDGPPPGYRAARK